MTNYKSLVAWQKSILLAKKIYDLLTIFPKEENYTLTSQIKRAAISISANIAEGCGRRTSKDTVHFLYIARGSVYELESHIEISKLINLITEDNYNSISIDITECVKLINGLIKRYESLP